MEAQQKKSIRSKVYLLIVIIISLLGVNFFLFYKNKKQTQSYILVESERDSLKRQLESIEAELNKINSDNAILNTTLQIEKESVKRKLNELKLACATGKLSQPQLEKAKKQIVALKSYVSSYQQRLDDLTTENADLKLQNAELKKTTDSLRNWIDNLTAKLNTLTKENSNLENKLKAATALKAGSITIVPKRAAGGKDIIAKTAKQTTKLDIKFSIVSNLLADKGMHTIYLQIFDPYGKLIAPNNNAFEADGQNMVATSVSAIDYNGENSNYNIEWSDNFGKGSYTIILFSDGSELGRETINLK